MHELTRRGVCYDLEKSPYQIELWYGDKLIIFSFSSANNKERFKTKLLDHRKKLEKSLTNRFKIIITFDILADLILYKNVEKRGFYLCYDGEVFKQWPATLKLDGVKKMK